MSNGVKRELVINNDWLMIVSQKTNSERTVCCSENFITNNCSESNVIYF